ncbi:MAG: ATP-binding protein [Candidatus Methylomirabilales bacterium]
MTLRQKLIVAFSIMVVPLLVIGVLTLWTIREENVALEQLQVGLGKNQIFAELESTILKQVRDLRDYLTGWDPEAKTEFEWLDRVVHELMEEWKRAVSHPEDVGLAMELEQLHDELSGLGHRALTLFEIQRKEEAIQLVREELDGRLLPDLEKTIKLIYRTARTHHVKGAFARLEDIESSTRMIVILTVAAFLVFGVFFSLLISRSLAQPVEELKRAMDIVGGGRLDHTIEVRSRDEIGELARSFIDMTQKLQRTQEAMVGLNAELQHNIQSLKETQDQLIQSEKLASLGQMSAAVAHGLRNPLASIRAATQLSLRRVPREDPLREQLGSVIGEVDRLEKRITHLLDFTKPSPHRPVAEKPERLFQDVLPAFSEKFTQQEIRLRVDYAGDLPEVWVDPFQIELALLEVISNAVEAMPKGGTLTISTQDGQAGGARSDFLEVIITDTGEGVPEDSLSRVCEPFFTTKADGTGLGLAIAKRFIEQNKGTLTISSQVNTGTSVKITLPIAAMHEATQE